MPNNDDDDVVLLIYLLKHSESAKIESIAKLLHQNKWDEERGAQY